MLDSSLTDELKNTQDAALYIGSIPTTMRTWRHFDRGPRYVKVGGRVFYRTSDLDEWLDLRTVETSESVLISTSAPDVADDADPCPECGKPSRHADDDEGSAQ